MREKLESLKIISSSGQLNVNSQRIIRRRPEILNEIVTHTQWLPENSTLKMRLYCVIFDVLEIPKCQICNKTTKFEERGSPRFNKTCSKKCASKLTMTTLGDRGIKRRAHNRSLTLQQTGFRHAYQKAHATKVQKGIHLPECLRSEYENYRSTCWKVTRQNDLSKLPNIEKRGRCGVNGAYQLDHRFSIFEGFKLGVDPKIIGCIHNLQMIPWKDNCKKNNSCSISLEHLTQQFNQTP